MESAGSRETRRSATLWMGDLEPYMDDNFLVHAFREALERSDNIVREVKAPLNKMTGLPMGYCFVEFIDQNIASKVLQTLPGKPIPNSNPPKRFKLNTVGDKSNQERSTEWSVWVGDLDVMVDDSALFNHFASTYTSTTAAKVVCDKMTGLSRGFAFVRFSDETEQQKAMIELNNTLLLGRRIKIRAAQPRTNYNNQYHNQHNMYGDAGYNQMMNQGQWYKSQYYNSRNNVAHSQYTEYDEQESSCEPVLVDDSKEINKDFVNMSGEVYEALESSRWFGDIHPSSETFIPSY